jgi:tRNA/tmRNA/rRNA uracil-C5-methylase (TrmA/RlmC/RlmD family)
MPDLVPQAQGDRAVRSRPGAVGGVVPQSAAGGAAYTAGQDLEVIITDVAQGGWCVARPDGLPVLFVRHALPGERVVARVTEVTSKFARADTVRVLRPSPDRVDAPCPHARPGGCGGCDWQHASLPAQRALKAAVITQQLRRLAGIDREVTVEPLPGDEPAAAATATAAGTSAEAGASTEEGASAAGGTAPGLGWRTRVQFAVDRDGVAGLRGHRSHRVIDVGDCLIAHQAVRDLDIPGDEWSGATMVEVAAGGAESTENFAVTVVEEGGHGQRDKLRGRDAGNGNRRGGSGRPSRPRRTLVEGRPYLAERAAGRLWQVSADGFWQVHPAAAETLSAAVAAALEPKPGDMALDLYCGAGLFAGVVAPLVGPDGAVTGVESDSAAVRNARQNLSDYPWARFLQADAAQAASAGDLPPATLVVADPPRAGLAREVVSYLTGDTPPRRFAYVSCDPATLARDLGLLTAGGWRLDGLRAFDAFPMTHHVECVATLSR